MARGTLFGDAHVFFYSWPQWLNEVFSAFRAHHKTPYRRRPSNRFRPECFLLEDRLAPAQAFAQGDVFVAIGNGEVQWLSPTGQPYGPPLDNGLGKDTIPR